MFKSNPSRDEKNSENKKLRAGWLSFLSEDRKDSMLDAAYGSAGFIQEDLKIRAMAEDILKKEFGENISKIKNYDFLIDSIVNRIKENQMNEFEADKKQI